MAKHNEIGKIGEDLASKWLKDSGFMILERNYRKKWGEIDIVARETGTIHFVEVKSVSYETKHDLEQNQSSNSWRPEENVHKSKILRLKNTINTWIQEKKYTGKFEIAIITVKMVPREKYAAVKLLKNVIFE